MNDTPAFCILLVEKDNLIAGRFSALVPSDTSVVRFNNVKDAGRWLSNTKEVDLIIVEENAFNVLLPKVRNNPSWQHVPVLVACFSLNKQLIAAAIKARATDLLVLTENDQDIRITINNYLDLNKRVLSVPPVSKKPVSVVFSMPLWKRGIDVAVSLTALLLASPVMILTALFIKLDSKGPILYKSLRIGANYKEISMYKFRTMKVQADQLISQMSDQNIYAKKPTAEVMDEDTRCTDCKLKGVVCQQPLFDQDKTICEKVYQAKLDDNAKFMKFRNDPRITRLGGFLRNSSIDELPQLFNILFGDMSLVGNRPLPPYEAEQLTTNLAAERFAGPAGLTGLWQVKKRAKGKGPVSDEERIALDIEYARTFSFKTDMYIIWKTIFSVWQKENV
ncbi:sugar transferase [Spirosoma sp. KUDC1026]|uniref:sugar transferase n=1 Tax=Spirosoma sp. KUDC1026 TaxID=2745947 RepID=UPI00293BF2DF|nr:sugar transferase [Spirosoma sp. KUDC1026]